MSDLNNVTLVGRLIRDPEVRFSAGGTAVASFSIAANHRYSDKGGQWKDEVAFVPCTAFGTAAEQLTQAHKGEPVFVTGRLRTDTWQKEGATHSRLVLRADAVHLILNRPKVDAVTENNGAVPSPPAETQKPVPF